MLLTGVPQRQKVGMAKYRVTLTSQERDAPGRMISRGKTDVRTLAHAPILLQAYEVEGGPAWADEGIAAALNVSVRTVERVTVIPAPIAASEKALSSASGAVLLERNGDGGRRRSMILETLRTLSNTDLVSRPAVVEVTPSRPQRDRLLLHHS